MPATVAAMCSLELRRSLLSRPSRTDAFRRNDRFERLPPKAISGSEDEPEELLNAKKPFDFFDVRFCDGEKKAPKKPWLCSDPGDVRR